MKKFRVIRKDSGLKSGSREVSLTAALKYPVYSPVQGKDVSHKALKLSISGSRSRFKKNLSLAKKLKITEEDLLP